MNEYKNEEDCRRNTIFLYRESHIRHFKDLENEQTVNSYLCAMKHFTRFRNKEEIEMPDPNVNQMKDFQACLV